MKTFIIYAVLIAFFAGILASSAFAFGCPNMTNGAAMADMSADSGSSMPCHEKNSSKKPCEGLCLCLDLSINQLQVLDKPFVMTTPNIVVQAPLLTHDERAVSIQSSPILKPPILLS